MAGWPATTRFFASWRAAVPRRFVLYGGTAIAMARLQRVEAKDYRDVKAFLVAEATLDLHVVPLALRSARLN